jgi:hypothetical protein
VTTFAATPLSAQQAKMLAKTQPVARIAVLQLKYCGMNAESTGAIARELKHMPSLKVDMSGNTFDGAGVQCLAEALPVIGELTLNTSDFTEAQKDTLDKAAGDCGKEIVWNEIRMTP